MTDELTHEERDIVRGAAFGALALVSKAEPGFLAAFRESLAGSRVLAGAPEQIRDLLAHGGLPAHPPTGSATDVENSVLEQLGQAERILRGRSADLLGGFRSVVLAGCDAVADAVKGVSEAELAMIERVRHALSSGEPAAAADRSVTSAVTEAAADATDRTS